MNRHALKQQLLRHEGMRLFPYKDTMGKWTIGVGRNLTDCGITEDEAMLLLEHDVAKVEQQVRQALPWVFQLDEARQHVLVNMAFNLGIAGLMQFGRTLKAIEAGEYQTAAAYMLDSLWARQVKGRALELAEQMRGGTVAA